MKEFFYKNRQYLAYLSLVCWIITSMASAHTHLCFDGIEPPVSVQFEVLDTPTHIALEQHEDVDVDPAKPLFAKLLKVDLLLLLTVVGLLGWLLVSVNYCSIVSFPLPARLRFLLRPPLRAPPVFPA